MGLSIGPDNELRVVENDFRYCGDISTKVIGSEVICRIGTQSLWF